MFSREIHLPMLEVERPNLVDAVDSSVIGGRLLPVSDIKDPLENTDERQRNHCGVGRPVSTS